MERTIANYEKAREIFERFVQKTSVPGMGQDLRFLSEWLYDTRAAIEPSVQANVTFVEHGYQIDLLIDGEDHGSVCRDFGGNHDVHDMSIHLAARLVKVMQGFEKDFVETSKRKAG